MTAVLQGVVVIEWLLVSLGAFAFLVVYGRPWRYRDRTMAWHLAMVTLVAGVEPLGLLVAGLSLLPSAIIYGSSASLIYWRLWLLLRTRRRDRQSR